MFPKNLKLIAFASWMIVASCGSPMESASDTRQITKKESKCKTYTPEEITEFKAKMRPNFIGGYNAEAYENVVRNLKGIPMTYMQWLYDVDGFRITANGMQGGVTEFGLYPISLKTGTSAHVIEMAMQHEVGHALTPYFTDHQGKDFGNKFWKDLKSEGNSNFSNPNLHDYPKSYGKGSEVYFLEYFAEAFNSYYCSPESNELFKTQIPTTHAWLETFLEKQVWASPSTSTPNTSNIFVHLNAQSSNAGAFAVASDADATNAFLCNRSKEECLKDLAATERKLSYIALSKVYTKGNKKAFWDNITIDGPTSGSNIVTSSPVTIVVFKPTGVIARSINLSK